MAKEKGIGKKLRDFAFRQVVRMMQRDSERILRNLRDARAGMSRLIKKLSYRKILLGKKAGRITASLCKEIERMPDDLHEKEARIEVLWGKLSKMKA